MTELLQLYWPTILAAAFTGATLSVVGALLVTRQAAVQTLAVSQSAGLGISIGLLVAQLYFADSHVEHTLFPLFFGLLISGLSFIGTEWLARKSHSQTVVYLAAFGTFWACSQLFTGFFPLMESHATALYFGDIVTLTKEESLFFLLLSAAFASYLGIYWRKISGRAFLCSILDEPVRITHPVDLTFFIVSLVLVCLAVQLLGLLFTLSCLFIPTAAYSYSLRVGVGSHLFRVAACSAVSVGCGFILSLADPRFSTTPLITIFLGAVPAYHLLHERFFFRCN